MSYFNNQVSDLCDKIAGTLSNHLNNNTFTDDRCEAVLSNCVAGKKLIDFYRTHKNHILILFKRYVEMP